MVFTKEQAKEGIQKLVDEYKHRLESGKAQQMTEEETKKDFILPLFRFLNWSVEDSNEVSAEETISKKRVDYGFRIEGIPKFFLEAKALKEKLDLKEIEQAINYSWLKDTTWAVLTNFAELKIFNAKWKSKGIVDKRFFELNCEEFITKFNYLWHLSKDSFLNHEIDTFAEDVSKKDKKTPITPVIEQIFNDLMLWREKLTKDIIKWDSNKDIYKNEELLDECVQRILDRLIFIRVCEDRKLEPPTLKARLNEWKGNRKGKIFMQVLKEIFREFDKYYDGTIFDEHVSEDLVVSDVVINSIIYGLYQSSDRVFFYDFSAIDADVLGNIYEEYLGYILRKSKKRVGIAENHMRRKKMGIYYTPTFIVDYIVKNTVGTLLSRMNSKEIESIKILDPACGSGSFLIKVFDYLLDYHKAHSEQNLVSFLRKIKILTDNIHGVDLDPKAGEIAQLNLLLRAVEKRKRLPELHNNIKIGNSLIDEIKLSKKMLDWNEEFKDIMKMGGFDIVIGNPPYINAIQLTKTVGREIKQYWKSKYYSAKGAYDIFILFFEQALNICKDGGYVAFITPNKYLSSPYGIALRELILKNYKLVKVLDLSRVKVFNDPSVYPIITIIQKIKPIKEYTIITEKVFSEDITNKKTYQISSKVLEMISGNNWGIILSDNASIIQNIFERSKPLKEIAEVQATSTASESDSYSKFISEESGIPIVNTGTIDRYSTKYGIKSFTHKGKKLKRPLLDISRKEIKENRKQLYKTPKIIFAKIALRPEGLLDYKGKYASINTNCVHTPKEGYDLKFLAGILNSKLMSFVYSEIFSGLKMSGGYFQFQAPQLRILPIVECPESDKRRKTIVELVDKIIVLNENLNKIGDKKTNERRKIEEEIKRIDKEIDQKVYELYGLTPEEIKIVESSALPK